MAELGDIINTGDVIRMQSEAVLMWLQTEPNGRGMSVVNEVSLSGFLFMRRLRGTVIIRQW